MLKSVPADSIRIGVKWMESMCRYETENVTVSHIRAKVGRVHEKWFSVRPAHMLFDSAELRVCVSRSPIVSWKKGNVGGQNDWRNGDDGGVRGRATALCKHGNVDGIGQSVFLI